MNKSKALVNTYRPEVFVNLSSVPVNGYVIRIRLAWPAELPGSLCPAVDIFTEKKVMIFGPME